MQRVDGHPDLARNRSGAIDYTGDRKKIEAARKRARIKAEEKERIRLLEEMVSAMDSRINRLEEEIRELRHGG